MFVRDRSICPARTGSGVLTCTPAAASASELIRQRRCEAELLRVVPVVRALEPQRAVDGRTPRAWQSLGRDPLASGVWQASRPASAAA